MATRQYIWIVSALSLIVGGPLAAATDDVPAEFRSAVDDAQRLGALLYEAVYKGESPEESVYKPYLEALRRESCGFQFQPLVIKDGESRILYFIAHSDKESDLLVGKHFKVVDGKLEPSTKTCLNLGTPAEDASGKRPVLVAVAHLMSPTPSEYHVFISLKQPVALGVIASSGTWAVANGAVWLHDRRERTKP